MQWNAHAYYVRTGYTFGNLYCLGVAGLAIPGTNLQQQAGSDLDNWTTAQAAEFNNF